MDKKKMIIIIGAVVGILMVVVAIICVSAFALRANKAEISPVEGANLAGEMGIGYGGDFNEFDTDMEESDEEEVYEEEVPTKEEMEEEGERIRKEFEESKSESITDENGNIREDRGDEFGSLKKPENTLESSENVDGEPAMGEDGEIVLPVFDSEGYAEHEVLCDAATWEDAEKIATQISGTVLSCENGVAIIQIEGSVDELLEELERQGSELQLYRNYYYSVPQ